MFPGKFQFPRVPQQFTSTLFISHTANAFRKYFAFHHIANISLGIDTFTKISSNIKPKLSLVRDRVAGTNCCKAGGDGSGGCSLWECDGGLEPTLMVDFQVFWGGIKLKVFASQGSSAFQVSYMTVSDGPLVQLRVSEQENGREERAPHFS